MRLSGTLFEVNASMFPFWAAATVDVILGKPMNPSTTHRYIPRCSTHGEYQVNHAAMKDLRVHPSFVSQRSTRLYIVFESIHAKYTTGVQSRVVERLRKSKDSIENILLCCVITLFTLRYLFCLVGNSTFRSSVMCRRGFGMPDLSMKTMCPYRI